MAEVDVDASVLARAEAPGRFKFLHQVKGGGQECPPYMRLYTPHKIIFLLGMMIQRRMQRQIARYSRLRESAG